MLAIDVDVVRAQPHAGIDNRLANARKGPGGGEDDAGLLDHTVYLALHGGRGDEEVGSAAVAQRSQARRELTELGGVAADQRPAQARHTHAQDLGKVSSDKLAGEAGAPPQDDVPATVHHGGCHAHASVPRGRVGKLHVRYVADKLRFPGD